MDLAVGNRENMIEIQGKLILLVRTDKRVAWRLSLYFRETMHL